MAIVIRICVFLLLFGIADTKEWRPEIFAKGENVIVCMDGLQINGTQIVILNFDGFISKQHISNVMLYNPMKEQVSVNINYTGRIEMFESNKSSLNLRLLNVTFMDSGAYTVSVMEDSVVKVETSILVARQMILGQHGDLMNITFMCNKTNISSIKIEMIVSKIGYPVVIYDVTRANCIEVGELFKNRIESCVFSGNRFSLNISSVTWSEKGTYAAWDDMKFLLDSVFVTIEDTKPPSSLESSKGYITLPSTVNGPTGSSKFAKETEGWVWLLFAAVGVAVTVPLTVASTLLILWRKGCFRFTCIGPDCCQHSLIDITSDQALKMGPISKHTTNGAAADEREYDEPRSITTDLSIYSEPTDIISEQGLQMVPISKTTTKPAAADEREYEEPRSNTTDLSIYLEPIGIETAHTENSNPGGSCSKEYEKLHPYGNQGNNMYSSLGAEHILENE